MSYRYQVLLLKWDAARRATAVSQGGIPVVIYYGMLMVKAQGDLASGINKYNSLLYYNGIIYV
jgi:hypothetical protein